eukprot:1158030-Pelagomonas_calceolata.AAC.2
MKKRVRKQEKMQYRTFRKSVWSGCPQTTEGDEEARAEAGENATEDVQKERLVWSACERRGICKRTVRTRFDLAACKPPKVRKAEGKEDVMKVVVQEGRPWQLRHTRRRMHSQFNLEAEAASLHAHWHKDPHRARRQGPKRSLFVMAAKHATAPALLVIGANASKVARATSLLLPELVDGPQQGLHEQSEHSRTVEGRTKASRAPVFPRLTFSRAPVFPRLTFSCAPVFPRLTISLASLACALHFHSALPAWHLCCLLTFSLASLACALYFHSALPPLQHCVLSSFGLAGPKQEPLTVE